jgi:hypothetical protein
MAAVTLGIRHLGAVMANAVFASPGEVFGVTLTDVPGSGFIWRLDETPVGLSYLGVDRISEASPDLVGDTVQRRFRFRADAPGRFTLVFRLRRGSAVTVVEEHVIRVTVA